MRVTPKLPNWPGTVLAVSTPEDDLNLCELVEISSGVEPVSKLSLIAERYIPEAFVPRAPWTMVTDGFNVDPDEGSLKVPKCGVIRLPLDLFAELLSIRSAWPPEEAARRGIPRAHFQPLNEYLFQRFGAQGPVAVHGAKWDAPRQVTVTVDASRDKFLGLHLDSWDGDTFNSRAAARTRISVNLGPGIKSFLCAPICIDQVASVLRLEGLRRHPVPTRELIPKLFRSVGDLPILRINLRPGMAYYADTDNLIHDGSTVLSSLPLMTYTIRAHFERL